MYARRAKQELQLRYETFILAHALSFGHDVQSVDDALHMCVGPLVRDGPVGRLEGSEDPVPLLLCFARPQVHLPAVLGSHLDQGFGSLLADLLVDGEGFGDGPRTAVGNAPGIEDNTQHSAVLDSLGSALGEMGEGGMAGVADQGGRAEHPGAEGLVDAELPLDNVAVGHELQHAVDLGAEVGVDVHHGGLGAPRGVRGVGSAGKVDVGLCGRDVVDLLVVDGVGDDVLLLTDPARHRVGVEQRKQLRVVGHLLARQHDAVRCLARVLHVGRLAQRPQHGPARLALDPIAAQQDVASHPSRLVWPLQRRDLEARRRPKLGVRHQAAQLEPDAGFLQAALVQSARQARSVSHHVGVPVRLFDVVQLDMTQLLVRTPLPD